MARDGADVVTLENYARTAEDGAIGDPDYRFYFQMYNTNPAVPGNTWHGTWTTTPMQPITAPGPAPAAPHAAATHEPVSPGALGFANPITMRMTVPDARYDAIAAAQYGAVAINTIKNDHNMIVGAPDAHQELLNVLKGLQYANIHLNAAAARPYRTAQRLGRGAGGRARRRPVPPATSRPSPTPRARILAMQVH